MMLAVPETFPNFWVRLSQTTGHCNFRIRTIHAGRHLSSYGFPWYKRLYNMGEGLGEWTLAQQLLLQRLATGQYACRRKDAVVICACAIDPATSCITSVVEEIVTCNDEVLSCLFLNTRNKRYTCRNSTIHETALGKYIYT